TFDDGLVNPTDHDASLQVHRTVIEGSLRAGVSNFGSSISLGDSVLDCNKIHLDSEVYDGKNASFEDLGGNACGCGGAAVPCVALTSFVEPSGALSGDAQ